MERDIVVPGVIHLLPADDPIRMWWDQHYRPLVEEARAGAPTALSHTLRWARAEVEYAQAHGVKPQVGVPPHWDEPE